MRNQFILAWLLCAFLDAAYATILTILQGSDVTGLWRRVASGPLGDEALAWDHVSVGIGIVVHLSIMAVMVGGYRVVHARVAALRAMHTLLAGIAYGVLLYLFMYHLVLPLRWPEFYPLIDPLKIALGLAPHILLVGLPTAWIMNRNLAIGATY